jgi:VanZ family protein
MPAAEPISLRRLFWPLWALTVGYSLILVWATHHPKPQDLLGPNPPSDKALHFIAYGLLGMLTAATLAASRHWSLRNAVVLAVALALAAVVDESTQPFFGRAAEALDWVFDVIGIGIGVAFVALACRLVGWSPRQAQ